jgi:hypothetical protein
VFHDQGSAVIMMAHSTDPVYAICNVQVFARNIHDGSSRNCADATRDRRTGVKDWYAEDFYQASPARDPQGPLRGSFRVLRGGEWNEKPSNIQASYRGWDDVPYWGPTLGVRCAEDVP